MDVPALEKAIRAILQAPGVDLSTISSKRVRKELAEHFGASQIKDNKEAIDGLIIEAFNEVATASGATAQDAEQSAPESVTSVKKEEPEYANGHSHSKTPSSHKHHQQAQPETGSEGSDADGQGEDDGSDFSDEPEEDRKPSSSGKAKAKAKPKPSPQKRRLLDEDGGIPPESSPSIPLSLATGLTDEEYARKLQEQFDVAEFAKGRATRGGGFQERATKKGSRKSASTSTAGKGAKGKKVKSKAYVSDSDLENDEEAAPKPKRKRKAKSESDDSNAENSQGDFKPKKKRSGGGGSGGGYNKELALSEALQKVCGVPTMSRPQIVKHLWEYIRQNNLQNPAKKSDIINDDLFKEIFGVEKMTMFSMNKYLKKAVSPIEA